MNHSRKTIKQYRDKVLGVGHRLDGLQRSIQDLSERQTRVEENLRQINHFNATNYQAQSLRLADNEVLTKIFTDLKMYLNPEDMSVAAHIALDGIWEKEITKAWLAVLKSDDTVLDIGANFGYFGLLSGQFTNKKTAKIVMFEANPNIVPYVNKSISINWLNEQVKIENLAVSNKKGTITLRVLQNYMGSSSVQTLEQLDSYMHDKMQLKLAEEIKVKAVKIDDYCAEHGITEVNLIKMDIEGHEQAAYDGMRGMISKSKDVTLFIEFTSKGYDNPEAFYRQLLDDFGYVYIINSNGELERPKDNSYATVIGDNDDWKMPVFSKNAELDKTKSRIV